MRSRLPPSSVCSKCHEMRKQTSWLWSPGPGAQACQSHVARWTGTFFFGFFPCPAGLPSLLDGAGVGEGSGSGLSWGREHCSQTGEAGLPVQTPLPSSSLFQTLFSQTPAAHTGVSSLCFSLVCKRAQNHPWTFLGFWTKSVRPSGRERGCNCLWCP